MLKRITCLEYTIFLKVLTETLAKWCIFGPVPAGWAPQVRAVAAPRWGRRTQGQAGIFPAKSLPKSLPRGEKCAKEFFYKGIKILKQIMLILYK